MRISIFFAWAGAKSNVFQIMEACPASAVRFYNFVQAIPNIPVFIFEAGGHNAKFFLLNSF